MNLNKLADVFDHTFNIYRVNPDPSMSRAIPRVYGAVDYDWQSTFEANFCHYFNGLMLRGAAEVGRVYCAVFPSFDVLEPFIEQAQPGDLLFTHHPVDMESGNPLGEWGRGFLPIDSGYLQALQEKQLSIYACHIPLDQHRTLGTTAAMVSALNGQAIESFYPVAGDTCGMICTIAPISLADFEQNMHNIFGVSYIDSKGPVPDQVERVAAVAGVADQVELFETIRDKQIDVLLTGEIHIRIEGKRGRTKFERVTQYAETSSPMRLVGVSHAASEFLVMRTHIAPWIKETFKLDTVLLPQQTWWR
ncbi:MAG: Nif3-like dinuclear metal center hexameric protein [Chloroflexota bacterium]